MFENPPRIPQTKSSLSRESHSFYISSFEINKISFTIVLYNSASQLTSFVFTGRANNSNVYTIPRTILSRRSRFSFTTVRILLSRFGVLIPGRRWPDTMQRAMQRRVRGAADEKGGSRAADIGINQHYIN